MTAGAAILELHDLQLLEEELAAAEAQARLRKLGLAMESHPTLARARERAEGVIDRRWMYLYQRARHRYGRGVTVVRGRVCLGCHITLPTAVSAPAPGTLSLCESCGRILCWS